MEVEYKRLKFKQKTALTRKKHLTGKGKDSIDDYRQRGLDVAPLEQELKRLNTTLAGVAPRIKELETLLAPYLAIKAALAKIKKLLVRLKKILLARLALKIKNLTEEQAETLYLSVFFEGVESHTTSSLQAQRQAVVAALESWWDKYHETYAEIAQRKLAATERLEGFLRGLGYE